MSDNLTPEKPAKPTLEFFQAELAREQDGYWGRFSSFSAMHAGLFVLVTSEGLRNPAILYWFAFFLGLVWLWVQHASHFYVNRPKKHFYKALENAGVNYPAHPLFSDKRLASTKAALLVPWLVAGFWLVHALESFL